MNKAPQTAITPTRSQDYPEWYQQVVKAAEFAEQLTYKISDVGIITVLWGSNEIKFAVK